MVSLLEAEVKCFFKKLSVCIKHNNKRIWPDAWSTNVDKTVCSLVSNMLSKCFVWQMGTYTDQ